MYRQLGVENAGGFSEERRYRTTNARVASGTAYYPERPGLKPVDEAWPRGGATCAARCA